MKLILQTLASAVFGPLALGVLLFGPAGTLNYWQAWVFIAVFTVVTLIPSLYFAIKQPDTLQRRMAAGPTAETRPVQRIVITLTFAAFIAMGVVSALDHRFGWSHVPVALVVAGNIFVVVGMALTQLVILQNNFAGASIRVEADQPLVSTGLYGIVRHPMYSGALILMVGTPLALGSYWGLLASAASLPILIVRIRDEEAMLRTELAGYAQYTREIRYRLVPYIW